MGRRGSGWEAVPLVGPGSELQLTLDGRAVPHHEVVAALERPAPPAVPAPRAAPTPISTTNSWSMSKAP